MKEFDLIAVIDGMHTTPPLPALQMVAHDGLTAVLTAAPRAVLRLPHSQRQTLIEAAGRLAWQEACMHLGTLLPARLGSPLTPESAQDFLTANQPFLTRLMQRFHGLVQVQVTVAWDEAGVLARFRDTPELSDLFGGAPMQAATLGHAVGQLARRLAGEIGLCLEAVSREAVHLPQSTGMLWNGAMLVQHDRIDALNAAVEAVDAIWPEGLRIRQIGPAPVGSFATLKLEHVTPRQIGIALAAFDLKSLNEIDLLAARRRERLMAAPVPGLREQADMLTAAARLRSVKPFALAHVWAEGESADQQCEVA